MKVISFKNLKKGMVIAEDIYSLDHQLLIERGRIIDSESKEVLKKNEIKEVKVYVSEDNKEINKRKLLEKYNIKNVEDLSEKITEDLKERFSMVKDSKLMTQILNKTIKYELESLGI